MQSKHPEVDSMPEMGWHGPSCASAPLGKVSMPMLSQRLQQRGGDSDAFAPHRCKEMLLGQPVLCQLGPLGEELSWRNAPAAPGVVLAPVWAAAQPALSWAWERPWESFAAAATPQGSGASDAGRQLALPGTKAVTATPAPCDDHPSQHPRAPAQCHRLRSCIAVWSHPWKIIHFIVYCHTSKRCAKSSDKMHLTQLRKYVGSFLNSLARIGYVPLERGTGLWRQSKLSCHHATFTHILTAHCSVGSTPTWESVWPAGSKCCPVK